MDVTLKLGERDFAPRLSTYDMVKIAEVVRMVKTLDGKEHAAQRWRDQITFSLWPLSDKTATADYAVLSAKEFVAEYTDPNTGNVESQIMRVTSDLSAAFGLRSIDGNRYYKRGQIVLRAVAAT